VRVKEFLFFCVTFIIRVEFVIVEVKVFKRVFKRFFTNVLFVFLAGVITNFFGGIAVFSIKIVADFRNEGRVYFFLVEVLPGVVFKPGVFPSFLCAS
jgi:hypothetical protein